MCEAKPYFSPTYEEAVAIAADFHDESCESKLEAVVEFISRAYGVEEPIVRAGVRAAREGR